MHSIIFKNKHVLCSKLSLHTMNNIFKTTVSLSVCLLLSACCNSSTSTTSSATDLPGIIPLPQVLISAESGTFTLANNQTIGLDLNNPSLVGIADFLNDKLALSTGFSLNKKTTGDIRFILSDTDDYGKEGYQLVVNNDGVAIKASQPAGIFYGVQSFLQLLPNEVKSSTPIVPASGWIVPFTEITDAPQFAHRGMMLDVSRHWFTKEEVMSYIDQMAEYKMNVFHWHLTDDQGWRIEIKSLPRLTEVGAFRAPRVGQWWQREPQKPNEESTYGGYYTQEDIQEVVSYAANRFVRVIPEIDVPGHSLAALVAYPEMACLNAPKRINVGEKFYGIDENSLCAGNEASFKFMEQVLTEVAALFPDEYIHIGGDECYKGFWEKCPKCKARMKAEGLQNTHELQSYFIRRMETILKSKGKKLIGWDEIHEGGLAPEATVMSWRGMQGGITAAQSGHHVIMTPNDNCYLDLYQGEKSVEPDTYSMCRLTDSYNFNPIPEGIDPELILGGQGNLWTESVPHFRHAEYMSWPRGWALAEVLWSGPAKRDWTSFITRVEDHFNRADLAEINYARSMYNPIISSFQTTDREVRIELQSELSDLDIYYTFDNTDPDRYSPLYKEPLEIPKDATWIRVVTYRGKQPIGKVVTLRTADLVKQSAGSVRKVGNL